MFDSPQRSGGPTKSLLIFMFNLIKRGGKIIIGTILLIFGLFGILLPLLPGIPFILIGGAIISPKFRHKIMEYFKKWKDHGIKKYEQFRNKQSQISEPSSASEE